jgi:diadenosine tetraphosphate (Ap4A) HIT family hydrolase
MNMHNSDSKTITPFFNNQPALMYIPWRGDCIKKTNAKNATQISTPDTTPTLTQSTTETSDCTFCNLHKKNNDDALILHKGKYNYVLVNNKSYVGKGYHVMIIPYAHEKQLTELSHEAHAESSHLESLISQQLSADCYEIQTLYHLGSLAGASIPNHLHKHVVCDESPRYYNLIDVIENTYQPKEPAIIYEELVALLNFNKQLIPAIPLSRKHNSSFKRDSSCYYCCKLNEDDDEKNLIIHRDNYVTALFEHFPSYPGHVIVIPNHHCSNKDYLQDYVLEDIRNLTLQIYPVLTALLSTTNINLGMISYQKNTDNHMHLKQELVPRTAVHAHSPGLKKYIIMQDMKILYKNLHRDLVEKFNETNIQQQ